MPTDNPKVHPETLAAQGMGEVADPYRDIVPPIYLSTTYERGADGAFPGGRVYSRADNPSYDPAEALIASLEGAAGALLFASGQAAAGGGVSSARSGAACLHRAACTGHCANGCSNLRPRGGWGSSSMTTPRSAILPRKAQARRPRLIWIETPANPTWEITDIAAASDIARQVGAIIAVDSTVATPLLTRPLELGAHIVMHSATKYLNGHSDVIAGALATAHDDALWQRIRYVRGSCGAVPGPVEAWLLLRGMRTLHLRLARQPARARRRLQCACTNIQGLAGALPRTGVASGARSRRQADARRLWSDDVAASQGWRGGGAGYSPRLHVFKRATSLGSVESLAEHRASVEGPGTLCPADLVRLSIGMEHIDDLISDIEQALA